MTLRPGLPSRLLILAALTAIALVSGACAEDPVADSPARDTSSIDLRSAPWIDQESPRSIDDAADWPSLTFAAGVGYPQALQMLYSAARTGSEVDAVVSAPLPAEVVYVAPGGPDEGLRLSLIAPWGWDPARTIRAPSISLPGELSPDEALARLAAAEQSGSALPEGGRVDVPALEDCQIGRGSPDARPPC